MTTVRAVIVIAALGTAACGNVTGNVSATKLGDTSRPAPRRSPVEELRAACGDGAATSAGEQMLRRHPYLQQVTTTGATLGWVMTSDHDTTVAVTTPAGERVAVVRAAAEHRSLHRGGERQMWASVASLEPGTIYCYQLATGDQPLTRRTGFRTAPTVDSDQPVRFLAFGDSGGGGDDQHALLAQMFTVPYDLIVHTGDLAYDDGTMGQYEETVFGVYGGLFRHIPFFPAAGNHDYKTLRGAPFREVFQLPGDSGEKWYSFDWGRVHFVALDTEADYATQARWLDRDLAANRLPWTIVYMHRPPYSSGTHGSDRALRRKLAPILGKHGVQLVLAGHDHNYERMHPQRGIAYVVTGGGGKGTRHVGKSSFTAFAEDVIHFVHVEVGTDELILHAIDASGREFDSMIVPRA